MYKKHEKTTQIIIFLSLALFLLAKSVKPVVAKNNGSLEIYPAYVDVTLDKPHEQKTIDFYFHNHSSQPISLNMFAIDFKQTDLTGIVTFLGEESKSFSYSLTSFLSFESDRLDLGPDEKKKFTVLVANRDDISPGGHYAAIVARMIQNKQKNSTSMVAPSVSSLIYLQKTGNETFKLDLVSVDWPQNFFIFNYPHSFKLLFQNEGNIHVIPYGTVEVKDMFNRLIYKGTINTDSIRIFPETRRYIGTELVRTAFSMPLSLNTLLIQGDDSLKKTNYLYKETFLFVNPVLLTVLVIVLIFSLFIWRLKYGKK